MTQQNLFLGVDCGGTKTEAIIEDEQGNALGTGQGDASNLHNLSIAKVLEHIDQAVKAAQNGNNLPIQKACLGISGIDSESDKQNILNAIKTSPQYEWIRQTKEIFVCSDGLIGFKSGTDLDSGICLIASTGSNCYGIDKQGNEYKAGNWGYILGDQGSGYSIGIKIINQVMKEFDKRSETSPLTSKVLAFLNLTSPLQLIPWVYKDRVPVNQIASITQVLNDEEVNHLEITRQITKTTVNELLSAYAAVVKALNYTETDSFPVVLVGGLFKLSDTILIPLTQGIKQLHPQAEIVLSPMSPASGAAKVAREELTHNHFSNLGVFTHQN